jgi:hypothetical protein
MVIAKDIGYALTYLNKAVVKGFNINSEYRAKIVEEEISKNPKIAAELKHTVLRNAWKMILEGGDWE